MNLDLHHTAFEIMIDFWFFIMTVTTLTVLCTFKACIITLTVFFSTLRFLACTFSTRNDSWDSMKVVWMSVIYQLLGMINFFYILFCVLASYTDTT